MKKGGHKNIREYFGDYLRLCRSVKNLRPETIRGYEEVFRVFFNLIPEVKYPDDLTEKNMTLFLERLQERPRIIGRGQIVRGIRSSTINTYRARLDAFFKYLESREVVTHSPFRNIKKPTVKYEDRREVFKKDFEKIIGAIRVESQNPFLMRRNLAIIYLLFYCGIRRGEIVGIQLMDLDIGKRMLTVRGETSKSKITRQVPLHPDMVMYLEDYLLERKKKKYQSGYLFMSDTGDNGLTIYGYTHLVRSLIRKTGVKFHLHKFRHTFATNLVRGRVDVYAIQRLLGHKDLRMTEKYLRSSIAEDFRSSINKLSIENMG
jgi:integrase/recombinase XerD